MKTETQPGLQLVIIRQIKCAGMLPIDDVFVGSSWQAIDLQRNNFFVGNHYCSTDCIWRRGNKIDNDVKT
jgi:hypothetical protein